jgi:hypothetical protein
MCDGKFHPHPKLEECTLQIHPRLFRSPDYAKLVAEGHQAECKFLTDYVCFDFEISFAFKNIPFGNKKVSIWDSTLLQFLLPGLSNEEIH